MLKPRLQTSSSSSSSSSSLNKVWNIEKYINKLKKSSIFPCFIFLLIIIMKICRHEMVVCSAGVYGIVIDTVNGKTFVWWGRIPSIFMFLSKYKRLLCWSWFSSVYLLVAYFYVSDPHEAGEFLLFLNSFKRLNAFISVTEGVIAGRHFYWSRSL